MNLTRAPLVPLTLAFGTGVATVSWLAVGVWWTVCVTAIALTALVLALDRRVARRGPEAGDGRHAGTGPLHRRSVAAFTLLIGTAALGALRATPSPLDPDDVGRLALPRVARVEGRIAREPARPGPGRQRVIVDVERVDGRPCAGLVQLGIYGDAPALAEGQRIAVDARLRPPDGFRNPGGFDYAAFLRREGIHVVGSGSGVRVTVLDGARPWHATVKEGALAAMRRALPPVSSALLGGLLLGTRGELPREMLEDFRRAGVYHVLAVSGFNVAIVASSAFAAALVVRASRRAAAIVALVAVVGFTCVVGPEPSVLRASLMAVLVLSALLLDREAHVVNSLALSALVILAVRPGDLADPGFQLSFAATAGIVLAPIPRGIVAGAIGVSVAAELAVMPITLSHFNQVSTVGLLANLGVVPLAAAATVLGLVGLALSSVSDALAVPMFDAVWPVLLAMRAVVRLCASVPWALVHLPAPHWTAIACYVAALLLALVSRHLTARDTVDRDGLDGPRPPREAAGDRSMSWCAFAQASPRAARAAAVIAGCLAVVACAVAAWPIVRPGDGRLRVTILDVGQGDAIVVEGPDRAALLVDAGSGGPTRLDVGERVVARYLWNRGILRLTAAITTHGDVDHAGGMGAIRRLFSIGEQIEVSAADGIRWLGPVGVSIFRAAEPGSPGQHDRHDDALVVRLDFGLASFLLASDIGAPAERVLLEHGSPLRAVVLKVPHHGSRGSSTTEFLAAVRAAVAVVSVGARNSYGHPHPLALARLDAAGATTYRTDQHGAVIVETDGRTLDVTRWADGRVDHYCLAPHVAC